MTPASTAPTDQDDDNAVVSPAAYLHSDNSDPADLLAEQDQQERESRQLGSALMALDDRSRIFWNAAGWPTRNPPCRNWPTNMASLRSASANWKTTPSRSCATPLRA